MSVDSTEAQWKDVFNIYDLDKDGKISKADFVSAVRVLGRCYTTAQMEEKVKSLPELINYDSYYGFLCDPYTGPTKDDLINALGAFDGKDCGELPVSQLLSLMTSMGDKIPADEARAICDNMPAHDGKVSIEDLIRYLTPPVPSTKPNIPELMRSIMAEQASKAKVNLSAAPATSEDKGEELKPQAETAAPASDEQQPPPADAAA